MPRRTVYSDTSAHRVVLPWAQARALTLTPVLPTTTSRQSSSHGEFLAHPTLLHANGKTSYCPRRFIVLDALLSSKLFSLSLTFSSSKEPRPNLLTYENQSRVTNPSGTSYNASKLTPQLSLQKLHARYHTTPKELLSQSSVSVLLAQNFTSLAMTIPLYFSVYS